MDSRYFRPRNLRLLLCVFLGFSVAEAFCQERGLLHEVLVFPFGWESEKQIEEARESIRVDLSRTFQVEGEMSVFLAPFDGAVVRLKDSIVLEGAQNRIIYPVVDDSFQTLDEQVKGGHPVIKYRNTGNRTFIFVIEAPKSPYRSLSFRESQLDLTADAPFKVFSFSSGVLDFAPSVREDEGYSTARVSHSGYLFTYMGLADLVPENHSIVKPGSEIGSSGEASNTYWVGIDIIKFPPGTKIDPLMVRIERSR